MRHVRFLLPLVAVLGVLAGCDTKDKQTLVTLQHVDSLRVDSLLAVKNDLLNEVQFVNDINGELGKLRSRSTKLSTAISAESDISKIKEERSNVVAKIREIVARLDSSETRIASLRSRAQKMAKQDSNLVAQVAAYEKTITDLRQTLDQQKADYDAIVAKQNSQIAALNSKVDTMTKENVRLAGERAAYVDTTNQLVTEKNTAYYVIGTKDDLIKQGVLVEEGHKRFLMFGGRSVAPARALDPAKFTKIDRLRDRVINFPEGEYMIFTRQNPEFAAPLGSRDGKLIGGLKIDQPERFWEPSKFLIVVKG